MPVTVPTAPMPYRRKICINQALCSEFTYAVLSIPV
jgi:hypothetical protein